MPGESNSRPFAAPRAGNVYCPYLRRGVSVSRLERINILGVGVHNCNEDEAVEAIASWLREAGGLRQVCTVNPEFVMEARRNRPFRDLLNRVDLATADGVGILLASRLLATRLRGRVTGVALVGRLAAMSAARGHSIFLLGAAEGVAEEAARELESRYPGVQIVGTFAGSPEPDAFGEIKERLVRASPDVLFVAYGAPRQDLWIDEHRGDLPSSLKLAMGVGGVYDYLAGRVPLAPAWVRRIGFEWLYRLVKQPWRWRRILRVFGFGLLALGEAVRRRLRAGRDSG
jgi:N-acetylglucosaminyldiphosphoundecaprenol N-acetyl-beta-D-mannosaminyltransferase